MIKKYRKNLAAILLLVPFSAFSQIPLTSGLENERSQDKGWFMYNESPEELKEENKDKEDRAVAPPPKSKFTAEWFRKNLDTYRDKAIDNPTEENILQYEVLQRVMMERSFYYARKTVQVMQKYPELDGSTYMSNSSAGFLNTRINAEETKSRLIKRLSKRFGLWFFFDDSNMSVDQAKALRHFERTYGLEVFPINTGDTPLRYGLYPEAKTDMGQAENLGIRYFPAVILVDTETKQFFPLTFNYSGSRDLADKVLSRAKDAGLVTMTEWEESLSGGRINPFMQAVLDMQSGEKGFKDVPELVEFFKKYKHQEAVK